MKVINSSIILQNTVKNKNVHILRTGEISFLELRKNKGNIFLIPFNNDELYFEMLEITDTSTDYIEAKLYSWNRQILSQIYGYICYLRISIGEKNKIFIKGVKSEKVKYDDFKNCPEIFKQYVTGRIHSKKKVTEYILNNVKNIPYIESRYETDKIINSYSHNNEKYTNVKKILLKDYNIDCEVMV